MLSSEKYAISTSNFYIIRIYPIVFKFYKIGDIQSEKLVFLDFERMIYPVAQILSALGHSKVRLPL